jgi:hypothetical protein
MTWVNVGALEIIAKKRPSGSTITNPFTDQVAVMSGRLRATLSEVIQDGVPVMVS